MLAKSFQLEVGGRYFDECLVNHFAEEFKVGAVLYYAANITTWFV